MTGIARLGRRVPCGKEMIEACRTLSGTARAEFRGRGVRNAQQIRTMARVNAGTGLGLSMSHFVMHNHMPRIEVSSAFSSTVCFRAGLPRDGQGDSR